MNKRKHVFQFLIRLREITPQIWRQIQVPRTYTFWDFHVAIQDAIGWLDYHLHEFHVTNPKTGSVEKIGIPDEESFDNEDDVIPGWDVPISDYFKEPGETANYKYDFGDGWEHDIILEAILERQKAMKYPICTAGARACPPEDCGGVHGYEELIKTINDPTNEEYESTMTWLGGKYDPEFFNPKQVIFTNPKKRWKLAFT